MVEIKKEKGLTRWYISKIYLTILALLLLLHSNVSRDLQYNKHEAKVKEAAPLSGIDKSGNV